MFIEDGKFWRFASTLNHRRGKVVACVYALREDVTQGWQKIVFDLQASADEGKSADVAVQKLERGLRQRSDGGCGV